MSDILFFDYNQKSSSLLIFFFNALVFAYLLFKKGLDEQRKDSKWLALFILLGGFYICPFMLGYGGWYSKQTYREFLFFVPFQQLFLIGPVFYFYIKSLLSNQFSLRRNDWLHFLPAIAYMIYSAVVFIGDKFVLDEFYFYADGKDKDLDFEYQAAGLISMLYYLIISLKYYRNYRKVTLQELSFADEIAFKWVKTFTIAFGLILILRVLFFVLNPEWGNFGSKYWYYLCFSILLLYISITGYASTVRVELRVKTNILLNPKAVAEENNKDTNQQKEEIALSEWKAKIIHLFENEKLYQNPNLTLNDLATLLKSNRSVISKTINQEFDINFNDYVNKKRVEAVIQLLQNGEHLKNTLLGIALDVGFNSKTTFNRAFKKHTSLTPKQYIQKHQL